VVSDEAGLVLAPVIVSELPVPSVSPLYQPFGSVGVRLIGVRMPAMPTPAPSAPAAPAAAPPLLPPKQDRF
jgi:hypothetical protein